MTNGSVAVQATALPFPGAVDNDGRVTFTLYAPNKRSVHLIGDFNDWDGHADPMREVDGGLWTTERDLPRGAFGYQFLIDESLIICDPYARHIEKDPGDGPRKAVVRPLEDPYQWHHDDWARPKFEDLVITELHIADFTPQRSFRVATERLSYIRDSGFNAVELMPIFGVHETAGWGYTPTYLFAPNDAYGTANELRWLVDECHGHGIGVILDMVLAHTGPEHPFNQMYPYDQSPWYGQSPAGPNEYGLPTLDYSKPATRSYARDVLAYWQRDFHIHGFRFDFIKYTGVTPDGHGIPTLVKTAREVLPEVYTIGEHIPEAPDMLIDSGMDGAWHRRFSRAMKALLCQRDFDQYHWDDFASAIRVLDPGNEGYGRKPTCMVNYLESHDEDRIVLEITRCGFDEQSARRKSALGATILYTAVGEPMLYQGQMWGEDTPKNMDHNYIEWEKLQFPGGAGLRDHYRRMAWLRRTRDALRTGNIVLDSILSDQKCVVYHRWNGAGDEVVVAANFSPHPQRVQVPLPSSGKWLEFFSNQTQDRGGTMDVDIETWAAKIFLRQP